MNAAFKNYLLKETNAKDCVFIEEIQSLWSGYGNIARYRLENADIAQVVIKCIDLEGQNIHPRGWNTNLSHARKVKSYEVETAWYLYWASQCTVDCRIPEFLGAYSEGDKQWIIMEDLNADFPLRKNRISFSEVKVCLNWLAHFHARFLGCQPNGLWEVGTYWHLATRSDEYEKIRHAELKAKAHLIDEHLSQAKYQTIVHGDAKLANFCFSEDGQKVAAVDFQYVGGGCGMKDVAYFLGSCLSSEECELYEAELLDYYFQTLRESAEQIDGSLNLNELESEWRNLYPFACADFMRFLLGWLPDHQKINAYNLKHVAHVLAVLV